MAIPVGTKAPDFTLKSKQASGLVDVQLSKNFGNKNTVLLFFPAAFTSVCTKEMCDISNGMNAYSGLNAEVIGISVDTPFAQEAWAQKEKIGYYPGQRPQQGSDQEVRRRLPDARRDRGHRRPRRLRD